MTNSVALPPKEYPSETILAVHDLKPGFSAFITGRGGVGIGAGGHVVVKSPEEWLRLASADLVLPKIYDIATDEFRIVTQADIDTLQHISIAYGMWRDSMRKFVSMEWPPTASDHATEAIKLARALGIIK